MAEVIHRYVGKSGKLPPPLKEEQAAKEHRQKLDAAFVAEKTAQVRIRKMQTEIAVVKARSELIQKDLVGKQAAYLLIALRQKIWNLSPTYARRLLGITDNNVVKRQLREICLSLLNEIRNVPQQVT